MLINRYDFRALVSLLLVGLGVLAPGSAGLAQTRIVDALAATEPDAEQTDFLRPTTLQELEALALGNNPTLAQSRSQVTAAQGRYIQGGQVSRVDFLQARVEVEAAAIELQNAKNRSTAVCRKMAAIVGVPNLDSSRLQGNLDAELKALTWDATLARLLSESPELAQAAVPCLSDHQEDCFGTTRTAWRGTMGPRDR